ncbi:cytochrome c biogenesis protein CcdA [Brachybacterium halotolerans subsp. kimchii]|uniref:cytochrome c biogenesis CcdA family protein n=1 Tax=Brachybacterium halotolerans TaxID=2795215 RepID=UPI001E516EA5|nr:cytochrome c biogenesis protein CcdA [Brachybacterium halotolerans]UEJ82256.1 cytochrome c biogenesis protein CcdA [Brachybacterium halotolerans subsp. kimchii]
MSAMGIGQVFSTTILSGSLWVALAVAAAAGIVAFVSPCVLPVVPGYLGYVSGLAGQGADGTGRGASGGGRGRGRSRGGSSRMALGAVLFVLGFAAVFVVLGGFVGALGHVLQSHVVWVNRISGILVIAMGLLFLGLFPSLSGEKRLHSRPDAGLLGAPLMGIVFGFSWTPCIGPTYAAVVALSLDGASPLRGALLALAYSLGLGIPFVLFALLFQRALGASRALARHRRTISVVSGALLIAIGVLLLTGTWTQWMAQLQTLIGGYETVV